MLDRFEGMSADTAGKALTAEKSPIAELQDSRALQNVGELCPPHAEPLERDRGH